MHRVNVAIFLLMIALIGVSPLLLALVYLARRRIEPDVDEAGWNRARTVPVAVITGIVVVASVATAWALSGRQTGAVMADMAGMPGVGRDTISKLWIPDSVAGQPMTASVQGQEAIAQVAALHGSTFPVTDAAVATYAGGRVTIWVSAAPDAGAAARQVETMTGRIDGGTSPFAVPEPLRGEPGVFTTSGMGQRHFYFASARTVWWIAADPAIARRALTEILEAIS